MAKFIVAMNVSLDGYVDHERFAPDAVLFRHWIDQVRGVPASLYGRKMYEIMRYWDDDQSDWDEDAHDFAKAWRAQRKWVVSTTLNSVGPNATLISNEFEPTIRTLKTEGKGEIDVSGTVLAHSLGELGLIDEYRLYYHPVVLGQGRPFFIGPRPPLRLIASDRIGETTVRLTYRPA